MVLLNSKHLFAIFLAILFVASIAYSASYFQKQYSNSPIKNTQTLIPNEMNKYGGGGGNSVSYCSPGSHEVTCYYQILFSTYYNIPNCKLSETSSNQYPYSPTNYVNNSNSQNSLWLLTAPFKPNQNPLDNSLFTPNPNSYTGGDSCTLSTDNAPSILQSAINYYVIITYSESQFAQANLIGFDVENIGNLFINNYGYSPMVDNSISNGFQTESYIYDEIPSFVQHGIWSWGAEFANFNNVQSLLPYTGGYSLSGLTYNEILADGDYCLYKYDYSENTILDSIENYVVPYNEVLQNNNYNTFNTMLLPYIIYNFSIPSPGSLLNPNYMNMSYDVFGPWNYYTPANSIDLYPIDTGSRFFVNYNGVLENNNPNNIRWPMPEPNPNNIRSPTLKPTKRLFTSSLNAQVNGPISIAASPNNYIYVLNYSPSQGSYYLTILRLIPKGYYNSSNLQPASVGDANSKDEWFSNWNNYWSEVINLQNESVYAVNTINIMSYNGSFLSSQNFQPLNISVDNFGDVFITGSSLNSPMGSALAEFTNTTNGPIYEAYNSFSLSPMPEVATSPTGSITFLAGQQDGGYIYAISTANALNFSLIDNISLAYSYYQGGVPLASLNIYQWLSNNGLYNQSIPSDVMSHFDSSKDFLDIPKFHHPLGIADINGYLYVLDEWSGGIGVYYNKHNSNDNGVWFNILELRVFNSTGANLPLNPTHFNDMYTLSSYSQPFLGSDVITGINGTYPPYGWIIAANITGAELTNPCHGALYDISNNAPSINFCNSVLPICNFNPYNLNPANYESGSSTFYFEHGGSTQSLPINYYNGTYYPIGPQLRALAINISSINVFLCSSSYAAAQMSKDVRIGWVPPYNKIGFSVNFNDTVNILFPNSTPQNPQYGVNPKNGLPTVPVENPNIYKELISTRLNIENYTKLFGGFPPYSCYIDQNAIASNSVCSYLPTLKYMNPPVYTATDALKYLESLGSPSILQLQGIVYSTSSGGLPTSYSMCSNPEAAIPNGEECGSLNPGSVLNNANSMLQSLPSAQQSLMSLPEFGESINSLLSGYILVPYKYEYTINQNWYDYTVIAASNPSECDSSQFPSSSTQTQTVYSYGIASGRSNFFKSNIEGGSTYLQYPNGSYYIPQLSDFGVIIPKDIFFNILTDRNFTNIYVNLTDISGDYQTIINASKTANFIINTYSQGGYPGFDTISSVIETNTIYGTDAANLLVPEAGSLMSGLKTGIYYMQNLLVSAVNLFDLYKLVKYTDNLGLYINQSPLKPQPWGTCGNICGMPFNARGYVRLIYVLNDKFNNTIYMPLDADIANITRINLHVEPIVSPQNANQTTLVIYGNATYFDGVKDVPLSNGQIYIYFNNNINYAQYNALQNPANAILCAFANSAVAGTCNLADPAFTSLSSNTNVITYYPQYNSIGSCGPAPTSLFQEPNYNCNIYGSYGLPQECSPLNINGQNVQQWCVPEFKNGTGTCTSQIGLMDIATTNSIGGFYFTTNACGIGTASITAEFYGLPYGQPETATQPPLSASATPIVPTFSNTQTHTYTESTLPVTFSILDFTWSPNETVESPVSLGISELSFGNISYYWIFMLILLVLSVLFIAKIAKR